MEYMNGNCRVQIDLNDGTKIRTYSNSPMPEFPESVDLKITDWCNMGCWYCHESSTRKGTHADLKDLMTVLDLMHEGTEIAIGGGHPLSHPNLIEFLKAVKDRGVIANVTVNQGHLRFSEDLIKRLRDEKLIHGLGISVTDEYDMTDISRIYDSKTVLHYIIGVNIPLMYSEYKYLLLGYKYFGRGNKDRSIECVINEWKKHIKQLLISFKLSFDNLAIRQLEIKDLLTEDAWSKLYMGDDGNFTMYADAVKRQWAVSSTSEHRVSFDDKTMIEFFKEIQ